ncbi:PQQ-dependent sugar dehydrogenase [Peijinzhouia sedimentorum]
MTNYKKLLLSGSVVFLGLLGACEQKQAQTTEEETTLDLAVETDGLPLHTIKLPPGFEIELWAEDVDNARSLARGDNGTIFVGNRQGDKVYALVDSDGDNKADQKYVIAEGLFMPNGVAFRNGDLYVAEVNKIWRFPSIESNLEAPLEPVLIYDELPDDRHHGWKYIAFGPDDKLYVPVGAPCNICEPEKEIYASITRMNPDGSDMEIFAKGIRNTVGFDWNPENNELWFTDNNRDMMGDDIPPCELNRAPAQGLHFGYPYLHGSDLADPEFGNKVTNIDYTLPAQEMNAHAAPLGMKFYAGGMFPAEYNNQIFVAEHGSWNRTKKIGYRVALVKHDSEKGTSYESFAEGWLNDETQEAWGRPVDVLVQPDGSILVSDDFANCIYRISYKG